MKVPIGSDLRLHCCCVCEMLALSFLLCSNISAPTVFFLHSAPQGLDFHGLYLHQCVLPSSLVCFLCRLLLWQHFSAPIFLIFRAPLCVISYWDITLKHLIATWFGLSPFRCPARDARFFLCFLWFLTMQTWCYSPRTIAEFQRFSAGNMILKHRDWSAIAVASLLAREQKSDAQLFGTSCLR